MHIHMDNSKVTYMYINDNMMNQIMQGSFYVWVQPMGEGVT